MDLLKRILAASEEEIDDIIKDEIQKANENCDKVSELGFLPEYKSNYLKKGFINLDARIRYTTDVLCGYNMQTTDYLYEFAHFIKKHNINSNFLLIKNLENYINLYFGNPPDVDIRNSFLEKDAWNNSTTDEEFFELLNNKKLGDFKSKNVAMCTERSAMAQQILSLFGFKTYWCMGCLDNNGHQEGHCFNIVKRKNDYALLDYSCPVNVYNTKVKKEQYYPFIGVLSNEEFEDFVNNGTIKEFENYELKDDEKVTLTGERLYVFGKFEIDKSKYKSKKNILSSAIEATKESVIASDITEQKNTIVQVEKETNATKSVEPPKTKMEKE